MISTKNACSYGTILSVESEYQMFYARKARLLLFTKKTESYRYKTALLKIHRSKPLFMKTVK